MNSITPDEKENEKKRPKYQVQLRKNKKLSHKHCKESRLRKTKPIKKHNFQKFIAENIKELKEFKRQKDTGMD